MDKSIIFGTSFSFEKVNEIVKNAGFNKESNKSSTSSVRIHNNLQIRTQIHAPAYFRDKKKIKTEIEFNDYEKNSAKSFQIINKFYENIPDLIYRKPYGCESNPSQIYSISNLIKKL